MVEESGKGKRTGWENGEDGELEGEMGLGELVKMIELRGEKERGGKKQIDKEQRH